MNLSKTAKLIAKVSSTILQHLWTGLASVRRLLVVIGHKLLPGSLSRPRGPRSILVMERADKQRWKMIEAQLVGSHVRLLRAQMLAGTNDTLAPGGTLALSRCRKGARVVLVSNSDSAVCRFLELPFVSSDQTERIVAHRLEMELPYALAETTWVCKRQGTDRTTPLANVLVIAMPTAELLEDQEQLRAAGRRCRTAEFDAAALAELAIACPHSGDTTAVACLGPARTTLVITQGGELRYVRRIFAETTAPAGSSSNDTEALRLASELKQSFLDYVLQTHNRRPQCLLITGESSPNNSIIEVLQSQLGTRVERASLPANVHIPEPGAVKGNLLVQFPTTLGALIATHRRLRGKPVVAPPVWRQRPVLSAAGQGLRAALIGANIVLLVGLVMALFGVRITRLHKTSHIIEQTQGIMPTLDKLEEEVGLLQREGGRQRSTLDVLLALSEALPKGITLATIKIDPSGNLDINGKTPSVEMASEQAVSAIENSPMFADARFRGATKGKAGTIFKITCKLQKGAEGTKP